jgi:two-component system OmpR family response regulator
MNTDPLTNVVDVYIGRLRKKLGKDDAPFIETVRGMGYRIDQVILPKATID